MFVPVMLSCLFIAALRSRVEIRANLLALLYVMFTCVLGPGSGVVLDCIEF